MITSLDYAAVLNKALSSGGEYADLFIERSAPFSIVCEDGKIEKVLSGTDQGAGVRLIIGMRTAYAYTNELTNDALLEVADAVRQAATSGQPVHAAINLSRRRPHVDFGIKKAPESTPVSDKVAMVLRADSAARAVDNRIRQAMVVYREHRQQVLIAHSGGGLTEDERMFLTAMAQVVASDGERFQTGYPRFGQAS